MNLSTILRKITAHEDLTETEMASAMHTIMSGNATPAQIGGFLIGLHMKGETVTEITAAAKVIRELAIPVKVSGKHQVDIVGTGGDQAHTFNISTASAFVAAAAGATVAKHNNRAISSQSGSADFLEAAGIKTSLSAQQIEQCIAKTGIGFMFAPAHHSSWKHTVNVRRELGVRTLFNILGLLVNPAQVPNAVLGTFAKKWVVPIAEVMRALGNNHVLVVHSDDGLDEISIAAPTFVAELKNNKINTYQIDPTHFGFKTAALNTIQVNNPQESLAMIRKVFANEPGPARDIVTLNAGAAIYAANLVDTLALGIELAAETIASGRAKDTLYALAQLTRSFTTK